MIEKDLVAKAAQNNAQWCHFVGSSHGYPGTWNKSIWVNKTGNLPFYPNAVTLVGSQGTLDQRQSVDELLLSPGLLQIGVKDSFNSLDLSHLGFSVLFKASWIYKPASDKTDIEGYRWVKISSSKALRFWEMAWSEFNQITDRSKMRLFRPELLARPEIQFLLAFRDDKPVGGGIINSGDGVVGISNFFYSAGENTPIWNGLCYQAYRSFPDSVIVSYVRDRYLPTAVGAGFQTIGDLRIWNMP